MPRFDLSHPPPSRPPVVDESVKDMELIPLVLTATSDQLKSIEDGFGPAGPILHRWLSKQKLSVIEQMRAHGLERRFAIYDSHTAESFLNPERGHLRYCRGDVIQVLRRCNDTWALGIVLGRVGLFPLEHTRSDNFAVVLASYAARNATEISVTRGMVLPTTTTTVLGRCQIYTAKEYGLVPQQNLAPLRSPTMQERDQRAQRYYQYAPLDRGHIRLIYITSENMREFEASGKQSLFITLKDVSLSKAPTYTAFSYCWGDATDMTPVFCNGKLLYVPSSLWRLLSWQIPGEDKDVYSQIDATQAVRSKESPIFWSDAICIDQSNMREKNHQIPLMQTIYQQASKVIAYVGESDSAMTAGLSMDMIALASQRNRPSAVTSRGEAHDLAGRVDWEAIRRFFSQPLFRRSWVIQEIILSREVTFHYGTMIIIMSRIHDCVLALSENHVRPANSTLGDANRWEESSEAFNDSLRQLVNLSRFKATWDQGGILPFIDVLQRFRSAQATDPRDKVYSLLGLAPEGYRRSIVPDYSASNTTITVYEQTARCALQLDDLKALLANAGISTKTPSLSSWAPDWSYEPRSVINGSLFSCSGSRVWGAAYVSPFAHHNRSKMIIDGSIIDRVLRTGPRWSPNTECELPDIPMAKAFGRVPAAFYLTDALIQLTNSATETLRRQYPSTSSISMAIWQTLVCGMMRGEHRAMPADEVHYNAFLECLEDAWKSDRPVLFQDFGIRRAGAQRVGEDEVDDDDISAKMEKVSLNFGLGSLNRGPKEGARVEGSSRATARDEVKRRKIDLEERAMPFLNALVKAQAGRRTCITERSYLAAVPDQAREGDEIAIFFGHPMPYVVRRAGGPDANGNEQFRLVGHCYVHGIMDGELADQNPTKGAAIRGFDGMKFALI